MARLINADEFEKNINTIFTYRNTTFVDKYEVLARLHNAPTIEAEPVRHGRWEDKKVAFYLKCSECGATVRKNLYDVFLDCDIRDLNYCPHCGARMYKEDTL